MKISKTISYTIDFSIEAHWGVEGGMGHECHSEGWSDLLEAIHALEYAENQNPKRDWQIIANVVKSVK